MLYWSKQSSAPRPDLRERVARAREAVVVQAAEIDALLEIDLHAARRLERPLPVVPRVGGVVEDVGRFGDALLRIDVRGADAFGFDRFLFAALPCRFRRLSVRSLRHVHRCVTRAELLAIQSAVWSR